MFNVKHINVSVSYVTGSIFSSQRERQLVAFLPLYYYPEGGGWWGDRRCAILQTPYINSVAPPPLKRHWTSVAERRTPIGSARRRSRPLRFLVVVVKRRRQSGYIADVPRRRRRPASPRVTLIQPQKKPCECECLLCHQLFSGHV